ncbi:nucleoside/nucleotide kinase family protein [Tessaracoccus antarcticus]|uniref:Nucleoside/nucleotide kinase family protein n=1 Tax=Tessaracoccus antarcticus TaxID=2479848 RepID=A0A3M0G109_9ACTN|nr:nucleoside/nucleotide kinase family protein [Tessaracoccus antarcticus]RMB57877.1 nucleoside/nucleotide kinase family protein [Tessaracoccus antarcticus]
MKSEGQRTIVASTEEVVARAVALTDLAGRQVLGLVGAPGSGKSTIADMIAMAVGPTAQVVEMDGYHLSNDLLTRLGRRDRKGAADTFDAAGYVDLLRRLRDPGSGTVYAPVFDRERDLAIVGATAVAESCQLVITTGNYLLLDEPPWSGVSKLLDHAWFLEPDEERRMSQLVARHERYGRTPEEARGWALSTDEPNAELVRGSRHNADLVIRLS